MSRLNNRAFEILRAEVQKCAGDGPAGQVQRGIVLKRLEKLRQQSGSLVSFEELRETVSDIFPNFSEKALKAAAKANVPAGAFGKIAWATGFLVGAAGLVWVANLPYPMIRWPVAKTAPILLLPSFISMDNNYRGAIASVEQADQLINNATSPADFDLGAQKVKQAQKNLDALPVWFLGYYPQSYCGLFGCTFRFTLDEFKSARASVGRMEATIFQERNAYKALSQGEQALNTAKQQYKQATATADKDKARDAWRTAIDQMKQVPQVTLAGKTSQSKLTAYERDFEQVAGGTLIAAAQQFALQAEKLEQKPPQTANDWQQVEGLWEDAIERLGQVPLKDPGYLEAQKLLAEYRTKLGIAQSRRQDGPAVQTTTVIQVAKQFALEAAKASQNPPHSANKWQKIEKLWETAIKRLEQVPAQDPGYLEAQKLLATYQTNLDSIETRREAETEAVEALKLAKSQIKDLIGSTPTDAASLERNKTASELQGIIDQLETVKPGTTAYKEARQLVQSAQNKLRQLQPK